MMNASLELAQAVCFDSEYFESQGALLHFTVTDRPSPSQQSVTSGANTKSAYYEIKGDYGTISSLLVFIY